MTIDGDLGPPVSGRVGLARLAGAAIALTDGVTATSGAAERWQTAGSGHVIPGVLAIESAGGRVEIVVHLVARWPPLMSLEQLGEQVRERLRRAAEVAGIGERLGAVTVAFDDVMPEPVST